MNAAKLARYRKLIGTLATWVLVGIAYWQGAPAWVLALAPGVSALAAWGLPNAATARQTAQVLQQAGYRRPSE